VKDHQQEHLRVLLLVFRCQHWLAFSPNDEEIIDALLLTGHLTRELKSNAHDHLVLTPAGDYYLGWLSARL
jgi:hypothetical protein